MQRQKADEQLPGAGARTVGSTVRASSGGDADILASAGIVTPTLNFF